MKQTHCSTTTPLSRPPLSFLKAAVFFNFYLKTHSIFSNSMFQFSSMLKVMRSNLPAELVEKEISLIRLEFSEKVKPQELYLFGSASEGKMTDHSDYDLLVVMKDPMDLKNGMKSYHVLRSQLPRRPIDVVWMHKTEFDQKKEEGGVAFIAFSEGRRLI